MDASNPPPSANLLSTTPPGTPPARPHTDSQLPHPALQAHGRSQPAAPIRFSHSAAPQPPQSNNTPVPSGYRRQAPPESHDSWLGSTPAGHSLFHPSSFLDQVEQGGNYQSRMASTPSAYPTAVSSSTPPYPPQNAWPSTRPHMQGTYAPAWHSDESPLLSPSAILPGQYAPVATPFDPQSPHIGMPVVQPQQSPLQQRPRFQQPLQQPQRGQQHPQQHPQQQPQLEQEHPPPHPQQQHPQNRGHSLRHLQSNRRQRNQQAQEHAHRQAQVQAQLQAGRQAQQQAQQLRQQAHEQSPLQSPPIPQHQAVGDVSMSSFAYPSPLPIPTFPGMSGRHADRTSQRRDYSSYSSDMPTADAASAPAPRARPRPMPHPHPHPHPHPYLGSPANLRPQDVQRLKDSLVRLSHDQLEGDKMCSICYKDYSVEICPPVEGKENAIQIPCKGRHLLGEWCFLHWFNTCLEQKNVTEITCPVCREPLVKRRQTGGALRNLSEANRRAYMQAFERLDQTTHTFFEVFRGQDWEGGGLVPLVGPGTEARLDERHDS